MNSTYVEPMCNNKFISVESANVEAPIYSFPIISSYITSYARIKMYNYLSDERLQHKIISTDTDSIFLDNYQGEIETSNLLGDMKLEDGYPIAKGIFIRPKMYKTFKPKCKGIKFGINAEQEFENILDKKPIEQERFIKFRTAIRSETHHNNGKLKPNQIIKITKQLDLEDTKRNWLEPFVKDQPQDSLPLNIDYEEELAIKEHLETLKILKAEEFYNKNQVDITESDTFDKSAVGKDISFKEFVLNEQSFEFLD